METIHSVGQKHMGSGTGSHSNGKMQRGGSIPVCLSQRLWMFDELLKNCNCKCLPALSFILGALRFPRILLLQRACLTRFHYAHSFRGVDQFCLPSQLYMALIVSCVILPQCLSSLHSCNLDVTCSHLSSQWIWLCSHNTDLTTSALRELTHLISLL